MAMALAAAGADVCIAARGPDGLKETAEAITGMNRKGSYVTADVTDEPQVERMVQFMLETYGSIDILVNSQGAVELQPTHEFDTDAWQRVIDVNLKSLFLCCKHVGRHMLVLGKGKIINISSVSGIVGLPRQTNYSAAKGGVNAFTKALAKEVAGYGIRVNAVAPGYIQTDMLSDLKESQKNEIIDAIPQKRLGTPEDVANCVKFLLSEQAQYITGQIIQVDGGLAIR